MMTYSVLDVHIFPNLWYVNFGSRSLLLYLFHLGLYCIRYPEMMLEGEIRNLINTWLTKDCASTKKIEVWCFLIVL